MMREKNNDAGYKLYMYNVFEEEKSRKKMIVSDNPIIVNNVWDSDSGAEAEQDMKHFFVGNFIEISIPEKNSLLGHYFPVFLSFWASHWSGRCCTP